MKIINLVIQNSKVFHYNEMYKILSPYYKRALPNFETYFIEYVENLGVDFKIKDDIILINGTESLIPGILQKTIDSILFLEKLQKEYDYIVRSNVSTVINFGVLNDLLENFSNIDYFSGQVWALNWISPTCGIVDDRYFETEFASGTLIGLSRNVIETMLLKRHNFNYDLIDDVSIGVFIRDHCPGVKCKEFSQNKLIAASDMVHDFSTIESYNKKNKPVAWRNKSNDRGMDVKNMKTIVELLTLQQSN